MQPLRRLCCTGKCILLLIHIWSFALALFPLPQVLVFSIGHTNVGRITQLHCDWPSGKIVLRQSRLLNFVPASGDGNIRDEEYWSELLYLLRWLEVSPVGKTQMATEAPDGTEE